MIGDNSVSVIAVEQTERSAKETTLPESGTAVVIVVIDLPAPRALRRRALLLPAQVVFTPRVLATQLLATQIILAARILAADVVLTP